MRLHRILLRATVHGKFCISLRNIEVSGCLSESVYLFLNKLRIIFCGQTELIIKSQGLSFDLKTKTVKELKGNFKQNMIFSKNIRGINIMNYLKLGIFCLSVEGRVSKSKSIELKKPKALSWIWVDLIFAVFKSEIHKLNWI